MRYLSFILLFLILSAPSQGSFFNKKDFELALGARGKSLLYKRGLITYEGYQILPLYSIKLFHQDLLLAGSALYYRHKLKEKIFLRGRINMNSTEDDPLYLTDEQENERIRRKKTSEFDIFLEYVFTNQSYLRFQISQDLSAHKGQYFEMRGRLALYDFYHRGKKLPLIQPALFSSLGMGVKKHNTYLYGSGAGSGLNNWEVGLSIGSPQVIDVFWPVLKLTHFRLLGSENRSASFVQEKRGYALELLMAFRLF